MPDFLLAIDAGNTRIKTALLEPAKSSGRLPDIVWMDATAPSDPVNWSDLLAASDNSKIAVSLISGSNISTVHRLRDAWPTNHLNVRPPRLVTTAEGTGVKLDVEFPSRVGLDRALNAVAANLLREEVRPAIVIDSGTATTVDLISADGTFAGGTILPGMELSAKALHHYTDLLPLVDVHQLDASQTIPPGKNTESAIRNGILHGHVGAIRELIAQMSRGKTKTAASAQLFLTGGAGYILESLLSEAEFVPYMSLRALGTLA